MEPASPSDYTFRWLLSQLDVEVFKLLLQQWITAQPGVTEVIDTLDCDGKTLRASIAEKATGTARFITQVSLYSNSLGVAIAMNTYASRTGAAVFSFLQTVVKNLLRRGGYRSIRQGCQRLAYDIKAILSLGGVQLEGAITGRLLGSPEL